MHLKSFRLCVINDGGDTIAALPHIDEVFTDLHLEEVTTDLVQLCRPYYAESIAVLRDVRRIPLKVVQTDDELEQAHLDSSSDGLKHFIPVDIYADNITTTDGLINIFHKLHSIEGFGIIGHRRWGKYSLLHVDVKIFWLLLRVLYCYPAFAGLRHDLFLLFGFWHAYHYAHVALWNEFRSTFLAPAFFMLYPSQKLMQRPKLNQSATFFMWLRLAYPSFRDTLTASIATLKDAVLKWQLSFVRDVHKGKYRENKNPHLPWYVHLLNLRSLFEFCIPCIQDYACTLKCNDFHNYYKRINVVILHILF